MKKILIIDDDDFIRMVMAKTLASAGYETDDSPDGTQAMEKLKQGQYDVVVTDAVTVPESGLSVAEHIRKNLPSMPVLVVSSQTQNKNLVAAKNSAKRFADETLTKPFQKTEFLNAVGRLSGNCSARKAS